MTDLKIQKKMGFFRRLPKEHHGLPAKACKPRKNIIRKMTSGYLKS